MAAEQESGTELLVRDVASGRFAQDFADAHQKWIRETAGDFIALARDVAQRSPATPDQEAP